MRRTLAIALAAAVSAALPSAALAQPAPPLPLSAQLDAELFTGWRYTDTEAEDFNAFELDRAELGAWLLWGERFGAELRTEAIRSAGPESLYGIDRDSILLRVKRAWGFARLQVFDVLKGEARIGLIPDLWIQTIDDRYELRALSPSAGELAALFDTSDLGVSVHVDAFDGLLRLGVASTNGEGRNLAEQNPGKNTTLVLTLRPLRFELGERPAELALHLAWRDGSRGLARIRDNRLAAALTFRSVWAEAGVEYVRADGRLGRAVQADALGAWAHGFVARPWLGVALRADRLHDDLDLVDGARERLTLGLTSDPIAPSTELLRQRLRLHLAARIERAEVNAGPLQGAGATLDSTSFLLILDILGQLQLQGTKP